MTSETAVQSFYRDSHVLITGATGFFGKALIEKLLRSCPQVSKLYLLIRCKKGKSPEARLNELFNDPVFQRLPKEVPNFMEKIEMLPGDCSLPQLGLDPEHVKLVQDNVSIVFHGAATVRFDENLKVACAINVGGVKEIIKLSHQMKNLKAVVHISTAYSNCNQSSYIEEKFYEPPSCTSRIEEMAAILTSEEIQKLTPDLLETWPNTYTMTKAIAEHFVKHEEGKLPICVFRPSIVISTSKEPVPGWIDNVYGPTGMAVGAGVGLLRVTWADGESEANVIPVDLAVNGIILVAKETHDLFRSGDKEIKIYNYESGSDNPITWRDYQYYLTKNGLKVPSIQAVWYYSLTLTKNYYIFCILFFLLHYLPAYAIDGLAMLVGKKPQMVRVYDKILKFITALSYFSLRTYKFDNSNVRELMKKTSKEDQQIFDINIKSLDWDVYFDKYILGARTYIIKDSLDSIPQALVRWRRLYWLHNATKCLIYYGTAHLIYLLTSKLYSYIHSYQ